MIFLCHDWLLGLFWFWIGDTELIYALLKWMRDRDAVTNHLNISTVPSLISSISFTTEESVRFCGTVLSVPSKTRWWRLGLPVVRRGQDSVMIACQI